MAGLELIFIGSDVLLAHHPVDVGRSCLWLKQLFQYFNLPFERSDVHLLVVIEVHPFLQDSNCFELLLDIEILLFQIELKSTSLLSPPSFLLQHLFISFSELLVPSHRFKVASSIESLRHGLGWFNLFNSLSLFDGLLQGDRLILGHSNLGLRNYIVVHFEIHGLNTEIQFRKYVIRYFWLTDHRVRVPSLS